MIKKIIITGMNCDHCVARVKGLFGENEDIKRIDINLAESYIILNSTLSDEDIINILGEDYPVVNISLSI